VNLAVADCRDMPEPPWLGRAAEFAVLAMDAAGADSWDLSLCFCGEAFMASLNAEYRGKEGPTDVLSFELGEWSEGENGRRYIAGDVVLCVDVLERNAAEYGVSRDEELKRLIVHGILHLSGLDHGTNAPEEPMLARQEALLTVLSEGTIF
jgi:probable rRNA maturation factor